jgi:hypothetical protein
MLLCKLELGFHNLSLPRVSNCCKVLATSGVVLSLCVYRVIPLSVHPNLLDCHYSTAQLPSSATTGDKFLFRVVVFDTVAKVVIGPFTIGRAPSSGRPRQLQYARSRVDG